MKPIAVATFLAFAVLAVAASAPAQEAPEEGSNLNDPAASVQAMVEASVAGRPVHVGTPVRASTKWFPGDGACLSIVRKGPYPPCMKIPAAQETASRTI